MLGSETVAQFAELALLILAIGGVAWCFGATLRRNTRRAGQKRHRRTAIQAQERAAKIMRQRRLNDRYAAAGPNGDPYRR